MFFGFFGGDGEAFGDGSDGVGEESVGEVWGLGDASG